MGWTSKFFQNSVTTTLTSPDPFPYKDGDIIVLFDGNSKTPTATSGTYKVVLVERPTYSAVNLELVEFVEEVKKPRYRPPPPVERKLSPPKQLKARHGFQQMCRIPCYRGVRTR